MKVLRVLTGPHAGARVALADGQWTVTGPADIDRFPSVGTICLDDWTFAPLKLAVDPDGCVPEAGQGPGSAWPDFEPRRFGDTVLCVGDGGAAWPSDLALLSQLVAPQAAAAEPQAAPQPAPRDKKRIKGVRTAFVTLCFSGALALVVASPSNSAKSTNAEQAPMVSAERAAKYARQMNSGLDMALLPGTEDWQEQQARIQVLDTMRSALHGQGVTVRYVGDGRFVVEGVARYPDQVREIAQRLAHDLAPGLKGVDVDVHLPQTKQKISAQLDTGGTSYAIRPDGTKFFFGP